MKKNIIKYLLSAPLFLGLLTGANAQRESRGRGDFSNRSGRGAGGSERQFNNNNGNIQRPERSTTPQMNRQTSPSGFDRNNTPRQHAEVAPRGGQDNNVLRNNTTRDYYRNNDNSNMNRGNRNVTSWQRNDRSDYNRNTRPNYSYRGGSSNRGGYSSGRYGYNSGRYGYNRVYVPSRHIFIGAPRYSVIPRGSISITFGGYPYYYNSGFFYNYYNGFYQPVFPPFGLRVGMLPYGYYPFSMGLDRYYYYNGIYYRQFDDQNYEVVDAPMGAQVSSLPKGAKSVLVNGEKFYELNGTYYKEDRDSKGKTVYTVVGKNGEIDNTDEPEPQPEAAPERTYSIGDVLTDLPEGTRVVTLNGEKLFVTPDETYFRQQIEDNTSTYKVVGRAQDNASSSQ